MLRGLIQMLRGFCMFLGSGIALIGIWNWGPSAETFFFFYLKCWQSWLYFGNVKTQPPKIIVTLVLKDSKYLGRLREMRCLSLRIFSLALNSLRAWMQLFYVLTKVIGCTWERKNFIHSAKYIQLSENLQRNLIFSISPKSQPPVRSLKYSKAF